MAECWVSGVGPNIGAIGMLSRLTRKKHARSLLRAGSALGKRNLISAALSQLGTRDAHPLPSRQHSVSVLVS